MRVGGSRALKVFLVAGFHETRPLRGSLRKDHTVRIDLARILSGCLTGLLVLGCAASARAQEPQPLVPASESSETPDADSLARYAPADKLFFYLEFQGTSAHQLSWDRSSAASILSETKTGQMLTTILTQIGEGGLLNVPGRKLTGEDLSQLVTHSLQYGFLFAGWGDQEGQGVFVVRNAFDPEIRPAFGHFLATSGMAKPGLKTIAKSGRTLVPNPQNPKGAWWIEGGKDLVVTGDYALVLDILDGKKPSAVQNSQRSDLLKPEAGFEPILIGFANLPQNVEMPPQLKQTGLSGIRNLDLRWGPEDQRLKSVLRIQAPAPRTGLLALMDQPTFSLDTIPPMPEGVKEFSAFSVDLQKTYDAIKNLASLAPGGQGTQAFASLEEMVQTELKRDLRNDILGQIGPRIVYFAASEKPTGIGAVAGALNPLAGFQLPQFVIVAEIKDSKKFIVTLNQTMSYVNEKLKESGEDDSKKPSGGQNNAKPRPAQFRMLSPQPLTYMLSLPSNLSAVVTAKPTILLGKKHLFIGATPDLARAAAALEEKTEGLWTPDAAETQSVLDGLPESLLMVQVSDPADVLPQDLVSLPDTLQSFIGSMVAASRPPAPSMNGNQPGFPGPGGQPGFPGPGPGGQPGFPGPGPGGQPGSSSAPLDSSSLNAGAGSGISGVGTQGGLTGTTVQVQPSNPGDPGQFNPNGPGGPGGPGGNNTPAPPASPLANVRINIPPDQRPDAAKIRTYIQPGCFAVAVDDNGLIIIQRESFPNIGSISKGMALGASLSLPAVQAARNAAQQAQARNQQKIDQLRNGAAPGAAPAIPPGGSPSQGFQPR